MDELEIKIVLSYKVPENGLTLNGILRLPSPSFRKNNQTRNVTVISQYNKESSSIVYMVR